MLAVLALTARAQTNYFWSGIGTGWQGQVTPTNSSTDELYFLNNVLPTIPMSGITTADNLIFADNDDYVLSGTTTLTLTNGFNIFSTGSGGYNRVKFGSGITLDLTGSNSIWDSGYNSVIISGKVTGANATPLQLNLTSDNNGSSSFIFNNSSPANDYTGGTVINSVGTNGGGTVAFWNSTPFGATSGGVTITNGVYFAAHNTLTLANNFTVTSTSSNPWAFRNWDAPLTLSGSITLASNAFFNSRYAFAALPASNNEGSYPIPGPLTRNPTIITGNVGEAAGGTMLTVSGPGITILNPTTGSNTYTGGTTVFGTLIFASSNALPATGAVQVGSTNTNFASGYAGSADGAAGHFATFLSKLSPTSSGAVGIDTLPGFSTVVLGDNINLTGFTTTAQDGIRLGTATSAFLTGTITPQGNNYHFGNGGGTLTVVSNLANITPPSKVVLDDNSIVPLKLFLQGSNTYTGGTFANAGFIIFDGAAAIPASGQLNPGGSSTSVGNSYIGYTDSTGTTPAAFLAKFNAGTTWGIIGFDTHPFNSTVTISSPINLTGFNDGVYLGTATSAKLTGSITPSTVTNSYNTANTLRFTAGNGGTLTVNSPTSLSGAVKVEIGTPASLSSSPAYSDGTVILDGNNIYSGGTTLHPDNGITLGLTNNNALGTGTLTIGTSTGVVGVAGLQATTGGVVVPNAINFVNPNYTTNSSASLAFTGSQSFELAGALTSGPITGQSTPANLILYNSSPINVTLSGDNSGYFGSIQAFNGTLFLANNTGGINNAAGRGPLSLESPSATVQFTGSATNEVLYGLKGAAGSLVLPSNSNLTVYTDNANTLNGGFEFGGVISGSGATLTVDGTSTNTEILYLYGNNTYNGGTSITGNGALGLGTGNSAGTGAITINAPQGGLVINTGVTLTNPIILTAGGLGGLGTFAPSKFNFVVGGPITIGANQKILPGIPGDNQKTPGTLTLQSNVIFANGGTYGWVLQDSTLSDGYSQLQITGNLDLTTISAASFTMQLYSVDAYGAPGYANLTLGQSYMLPFLHTTGTISGFSPTLFTFDVSKFAGGVIPTNQFSVSIDGTNQTLYLNFTAVPEPSTYALLGLGLGVVILPVLRRRKCRV